MKVNTPECMKFKRLQRKLKESRRGIVGLLELMWIFTANNARRGDIGRFSNEEIAIECDWEGDPDELVDALVETGFLDTHATHRLVVHDWHEHCPSFIHAWIKKKNTTFASLSTEATTDASLDPSLDDPPDPPGDTSEPTGVPTKEPSTYSIPFHSIPAQPIPISSELDEPATEQKPPPPLLTFETVGKGPKTWALTQPLLDEWAEAFPTMDVLAELRKAHAWIRANPSGRKTASGMPRFVVNWLTKATNRGNAAAKSIAESRADKIKAFKERHGIT